MPGLEPGIQAAPSVVIPGKSTLDARVKPVHDETESGSPYFWAFGVQKNYAAPLPEPPPQAAEYAAPYQIKLTDATGYWARRAAALCLILPPPANKSGSC